MTWREFKKLPRRKVYDLVVKMDQYLKRMQGELDAKDEEIKELTKHLEFLACKRKDKKPKTIAPGE